jgi:hypothetical protein
LASLAPFAAQYTLRARLTSSATQAATDGPAALGGLWQSQWRATHFSSLPRSVVLSGRPVVVSSFDQSVAALF